MNLIYRALTLMTLSLLSFNLLANETGYEVELIIFEDKNGRYLQSEDWSYNDMLHNNTIVETVEGNKKTSFKDDPEYKQLDWTQGKLADKRKKLANNGNYRILVNKRWKQTGLSRETSFSIPIDSLQQSTKGASSTDDIAVGSTDSYVSGNVKLIMSRYLHFDVALDYYRPQLDTNAESVFKKYPVIAERRMRSREIHYMDHPMLGVIVLATPYKIAEDVPESKPGEYKTL